MTEACRRPRGSSLRGVLLAVLSCSYPHSAPAAEMNAPDSSPTRPNIIVIFADDLGFGDLGCYGAEGIPTPNLDRMAREGVRFSNFYATAATCTPSRYSLLTGSYPWRNPRAQILKGDAPMIIGPDELTLPAALKRAGYTTSVIGKWHIGLGDGTIDWNSEIRPSPREVGFDESFIMAATADRVPSVYIKDGRVLNLDPSDPLEVSYAKENPFPEVPTGRSNPELLTMQHSDKQHDGTIVNGVPRIGFSRGGKAATWDDTTMTDVFLARTKEFLSRQKSAPFFLYLGLHQPHVPRIPSKRFAGASEKGPRGDVIMEMDWMVGQVLDELKSLGLDRKTIVVFSSDNGPVLDDGYKDESVERNGSHRPAGPLRGGKYSLFDGGARVPTIVWGPGLVAPGESDALLSHVDFLASFAHVAGADLAPRETADSMQMADVILGKTKAGRDNLVTEGFAANTVLREGSWVFIPPYPGPKLFGDKNIESGNSKVPQLYNLSADIGQATNVAAAHPEKVVAMERLLESIKAGGLAAQPATKRPPNVLFILCDDLGINDLHCYGRKDHNTPNLDRLAAEGTRFTSAYASQAICSASRAGLLTGLNPARLHLTTYLPGRPDAKSQRVLHPEISLNVPLSVKTLPRYFKEAGYTSGLIGKWHVGASPGPAEHGFDFVYHPSEGKNTTPSDLEGGKAEYELTKETINFIEANKDRPFVAYLAHYTPHIPYTAKQHLIDKNAGAFEPVYAALIETLDDSVGVLMAKLEELGLADDTIVVFTSDNGGLHVPEGGHVRVTHNTPFRAGKGHTYEGGQRVPLIVRWPGHVPAGRVVDAPVNNVDWIPTLLELAGAAVPPGLDGVSFAAGLNGGAFPARKIFWHFPHYTNQGGRPSGVVRDGDWLLVEFYDEDKTELYNLSDDIGEQRDLSGKEPARVNALKTALAGWRDANGVQHNKPNPDFDEAEFRKLYVTIDSGNFDPVAADDAEWHRMEEWRKAMNRAAPFDKQR